MDSLQVAERQWHIQVVPERIMSRKEYGDSQHSEYEEFLKLYKKTLDTLVHQNAGRCNQSADTLEEYYKRILFIVRWT